MGYATQPRGARKVLVRKATIKQIGEITDILKGGTKHPDGTYEYPEGHTDATIAEAVGGCPIRSVQNVRQQVFGRVRALAPKPEVVQEAVPVEVTDLRRRLDKACAAVTLLAGAVNRLYADLGVAGPIMEFDLE